MLLMWNAVCVLLSYKLKQKCQQRSDEVAAQQDKHTECHTVSDVGVRTSFSRAECHKRKSSADEYHDDTRPVKKLKFSSLFTSNPEIPCINR